MVVVEAVVAEEDAAKAGILRHSNRDGWMLKPIPKLLLSHWDESPLGGDRFIRLKRQRFVPMSSRLCRRYFIIKD